MGIARNMVMNDILNMQAEDGGAMNKNKKCKGKIKCDTFEGRRVASVGGIEYAIRNEQMELEVGLKFNLGSFTKR